MPNIYNENIEFLALDNHFFRKELVTNKNTQLVLMSIKPGEDIGEEVHEVDQILFFVSGDGEAILNDERSKIEANSLVIVPAGTKHNFINTGEMPLKLFTIYSPPEEIPGTLHRTKNEAMEAEQQRHGVDRHV